MKRHVFFFVMATCVVTALAVPTRALDFDFAKIVDSNTPMPEVGGTFQLLALAALDEYQVAFEGINISTNYKAIYISSGGVLTRIVDTNTIKPGTANYFNFFGDPSISAGNVAFYGAGEGETGVYSTVGGLNRVADSYTSIPSGTEHFVLFGYPSLDGNDVAFWGSDNASQQGIYSTSGDLHAVADRNTLVPGGPGSYFSAFDTRASISAGDVAFRGDSLGRAGVYKTVGGTLQRVADTTTPIPGGPGNFTEFLYGPSLHNGNVAFTGNRGDFEGIYTDIGGLNAVADVNTPFPGGSGNFRTFSHPSLDNGIVAFNGEASSGEWGIFTNYGGSLSAVITSSMLLDGKQPLNPHIGPEALSNGNIVFSTDFTDGSGGIYVAEQRYDYTANTSGAWDTASNWSFGLKPRAVVGTVIRPEYGAVITGPASPTTLRSLTLGSLGGVAELRLAPAGQLTVNEWFVIEWAGRLNLNGGVATAVYGFDNYGEIDLAGGQINGGGSYNSGTIRGSGTVANYLINLNRIQAISSQIEFTAEVNNTESGRIDARDALLEFRGGLRNFGRMNFSFGTSDVFGHIQNEPGAGGPGGQIIVSGNSIVTFYDDLIHSGEEFRVSTGSTAVFFGQVAVSPSSPFTGDGTKMFEGGLVVEGGAGAVLMEGEVVLGDFNTLALDLGGILSGDFDKLDVEGQLTLGGTLDLDLAGGFMPAAGNTFDVLDWTSRSGEFDEILLPDLSGALTWDTSQLYTSGVLAVAAAGLPGDYNGDGSVDAADYIIWRKYDGTQIGYDTWRANFGRTAGSGAALPTAESAELPIPEPSALWLAVLGAAIIERSMRAARQLRSRKNENSFHPDSCGNR